MLVTHDPKVAQYANRTIHIADGVIEDGQYGDAASKFVPVGAEDAKR
jgi:ABC-type lipoprotein export system ATPase subunit